MRFLKSVVNEVTHIKPLMRAGKKIAKKSEQFYHDARRNTIHGFNKFGKGVDKYVLKPADTITSTLGKVFEGGTQLVSNITSGFGKDIGGIMNVFSSPIILLLVGGVVVIFLLR